MTCEQEEAAVAAVIARYKETLGVVFGLRNFPGRRFTISEEQSYFEHGVLFYLQGVRLAIYEVIDGAAQPFIMLRGNELQTPAIRLLEGSQS